MGPLCWRSSTRCLEITKMRNLLPLILMLLIFPISTANHDEHSSNAFGPTTVSTPYRILQHAANASKAGDSLNPNDELERMSINQSWQPIYVALGLTLIQSMIFLSIFEWGRRNKFVGAVFDRRRSRHPTRTPAPLMQRRGCARGWLAFEWWKIRITDEDYQKAGWDEYRLRKMEEQNQTQQTTLGLATEEFDPFVLAAENTVYRESPFFAEDRATAIQNRKMTQVAAREAMRPPPISRHSSDSSEWNSFQFDEGDDEDTSSNDGGSVDEEKGAGTYNYKPTDNTEKTAATIDSAYPDYGYNTNIEPSYSITNSHQYGSENPTSTLLEDGEPDYEYGIDPAPPSGDFTRCTSPIGYEVDTASKEDDADDDKDDESEDDNNGISEMATSCDNPRTIRENSSYIGETTNTSPSRITMADSDWASHQEIIITKSHQESDCSAEEGCQATPNIASTLDRDSYHDLTKAKHLDELMNNVMSALTRQQGRKPSTYHNHSRTTECSAFESANETLPMKNDIEMREAYGCTSSDSRSGLNDTIPFCLDNVMGNISSKGTLRSNSSQDTKSSLRGEIKAVEEQILQLKNKMNQGNSTSNTADSCDTNFDLEGESIPFSPPTTLVRPLGTNCSAPLQDHEDTNSETEETQTQPGNAHRNDLGASLINQKERFRLVPMKQESEDFRPASRRPRRTLTPKLSVSSEESECTESNAEGGRRPAETLIDELGYESSDTDAGNSDMGYEYYDNVDSQKSFDRDQFHRRSSGEHHTHVDRRSSGGHGNPLNRRSSGGHAIPLNRRSSGGHTVNRRSSGGHQICRRSTAGYGTRRKSGDHAAFRGFSITHAIKSGEIFSDPRSTLSATSASVTDFLRSRVLMISNNDDHDDHDDIDAPTQSEFIATKITKRPLNEEERELLRCVGLDSFMTLRFLRFGFDVAFWPMLLSCVTLIPFFKTGEKGVNGFFSTTVVALEDGSWRYWIVMIFGLFHVAYILRRLWIEWEVFLPLRYEFLEHGDVEKEKYKEQYRTTCIVEYIPRAQKHDQSLYDFFDAIFPGQIQRAEVLLNTEHLRMLIKDQVRHITDYENTYAKKVHDRAEYLRNLDAFQQSLKSRNCISKCCCWWRWIRKPSKEPREPMVKIRGIVTRDRKKKSYDVTAYNVTMKVQAQKVPALKWHYESIQRLNREIDDEFMRLAQAQRRPVPKSKEYSLLKWLRVQYLTGSDSGHVHSSTAFVQFKSLAAKQQAIQCNITGMNKYLTVVPVPEVRDIIWDNMHVSRALIETRKGWANVALFGGLILWSMLVSLIRSINNLSEILNSVVETPITEATAVAAFLDFYAPALIVEGLVRAIPNLMKVGALWLRFKSNSEKDHYILRWYFGFRLLTFLFILIGGTIVNSGNQFVNDPVGFFKELSGNLALNAQFFISYVIVSGGVQVFFRLSQWHNLALYSVMKSVKKSEALSQRKFNSLITKVQAFHHDEFIPLFIFIFMVCALYGTIAPLSNVFVAGFYHIAYKAFKFLTLYVYSSRYEGGGFMFYTISNTLFYVLYIIILLIVFFLSVNAGRVIAGMFSTAIIATYYVHRDVEATFVEPSRTLSLAKARASDESQDARPLKQRKYDDYVKAKKDYDDAVKRDLESSLHGKDVRFSERLRLLPRRESADYASDSEHAAPPGPRRGGRRQDRIMLDAVEAFNERYNRDDVFADSDDENPVTNNRTSTNSSDFFIYRQPSLNKATWEMTPKAYREGLEREEAAELWGDIRPEQTRTVARQRRASIAMYYGD